jgi:glycosyltransferase involved in cell wall biosynthesis
LKTLPLDRPKQLKILFLLTQDLGCSAGIGRYFPLARELADLGHQVTIAALHTNFSELSETDFEREGIRVIYVGQMHVQKEGDRKVYFSPSRMVAIAAKATWALSRAALHTHADIIHIGKLQPMNSMAGLLAGKLRKEIIFLDCDDLEAANNRFDANWQQKVIAQFERRVPRYVDHITTHSQVLVDYFLGLGIPKKKITYLPHGIDTRRFKPLAADHIKAFRNRLGIAGRQVIVYVGSISLASHAIDVLLRAFAIVCQANPRAVLVLAGGGEDFDAMQSLARQLNIQDDVIFFGRSPADQVRIFYQMADVSVDPVHDNPAGRASLSIKMFETWANGAPLVTTDVGDRKVILGDPPAGMLAVPGDAQSLASGIQAILGDPQLSGQLRQLGMNMVHKYDWALLAQNIETAYMDVLTNQKRKH